MGRRWGCACQTPEMTGDSTRERSHRVSRFRARSVGEAIAGVARSRRTFEYRRGLGLGPNASAPVMHSATSTSAASDRARVRAVAIARVSVDVSHETT